MGIHLEKVLCFCTLLVQTQGNSLIFRLLTNFQPIFLPCTFVMLTDMDVGSLGLKIPDPMHIDYIKQEEKAVINSTVTLNCGTAMPTLFIWVFSKTESDSKEAIAYNYGLGPKTLPLADTLGHPFLATNTSSLLIMGIKSNAGGVYTCQALYETDKGPSVTFYYTYLSLHAQPRGY